MLRQPADHGDDPGQGLHLDRGDDPAKTRDLLELLGFDRDEGATRTHPSRPPVAVWVPGTTHTARELRVRPRQGARHDPLMALRLIYQVFTTLLGWIVLRARSDTTKDIEILILRQQLAVLQRRTAAHG